jgi:regulator of protease activity HflC (stomatin/prohibitin superfamily)
MTAVLIVLAVLVGLALALAGSSVRVLREYERGVIFRFGRLVAQKGPGLVFLVPIADRMVRVTLRTITHAIPPQDVITRDNVPARVDAVAYFRVVDADASVVDI